MWPALQQACINGVQYVSPVIPHEPLLLSTLQGVATLLNSTYQVLDMNLVKILCYFHLAAPLVSSKNVTADPQISGQLIERPASDTWLMSFRQLEETSDCHCDGTSVHCSNEVEEEFCSCTNETLSCTDPFEGCHCDGSDVHCDDSSVESACHCDEGVVHCE
jgi:hypothetical protein